MPFTELLKYFDEDSYELSLEERYLYRTDTTRYDGEPDLVIHVKSIEDIVNIMKFSYENKVTVIPRGAGTGMSGGVVALTGGIVINFEMMDEIVNIKPRNKRITVQPGVITAKIEETAKEHDLYFPPDPSSYKVSTIGGNFAENAGGLHCVKYGVTERYIKGALIVDYQGNIHKYGSYNNESKHNRFNPFQALNIGGEGTLGVIAELELELIDKPIISKTIFSAFESLESAIDAVIKIKKSVIDPAVMEIIDDNALNAVLSYKKVPIPEGTKAILLIKLDSYLLSDLENNSDLLVKLLRLQKPITYSSTSDEAESEKLWDIRRAISPAIRKIAPNKLNEDIVVPISNFLEFIKGSNLISKEYETPIVIYGHAGDGNLHVNILYDKKNIAKEKKALLVSEEIFSLTVRLGGSITGEHGIGLSKKNFLNLQYGKNEISFMKKIKRSFDINNNINPDKIFNIRRTQHEK